MVGISNTVFIIHVLCIPDPAQPLVSAGAADDDVTAATSLVQLRGCCAC